MTHPKLLLYLIYLQALIEGQQCFRDSAENRWHIKLMWGPWRGKPLQAPPQPPLEGCPPLSDVKGIPNLYTAWRQKARRFFND